MTATSIIPHLYQIVVPTPFPVGPVNVYLAARLTCPGEPLAPAVPSAGGCQGSSHKSDGDTEPLTLIDTGPRTDPARAALEHGLSSLDYTLADIERIIITHTHTDHCGLAGDIVQVSGARVYSHVLNRPLLEDYAAERSRHWAFYGDLLVEAGVPQEVQATVGQAMRGFRHLATAVSPVHTLDEGDELKLAGQSWQVLFMPGHTGGLICLYQPETRLFLSNDHLLRDISSNPFFEPPRLGQTQRRRSLVDYIASLERTIAMDIAVTWPGHGEPIHDHRALIEKRLDFHRRRADKLLAALTDGPQSVYALTWTLFPKLSVMDRFLAISEVLAHLEWLEHQGAVTAQRREGVMLWERKT